MQYRHNQAWFTFHYVSIKSDTVQPVGSLSVLFTFHYVSIKSSMWPSAWAAAWAYLHSTMYLLNRWTEAAACDRKRIYIPLCIY